MEKYWDLPQELRKSRNIKVEIVPLINKRATMPKTQD